MARLAFFILLLMASITSNSQSFQLLRYNDDFSYLKDSSRNAYEKIKYAPLGNKAYLSVGGEIRFQFFRIANEDWGDTQQPYNAYVLSRYLLHTDLHLNNHLRVYAQLQSALAYDKQNVSPVDQNKLDLHQAFIDYQTNTFLFRVGRQELSYGSQRLISVREIPNNRQAFDAVKFVYVKHNIKLDLFYSHYVVAKADFFDDEFLNPDIKLWGAYAVLFNSLPLNVDVYYFGNYKAHVNYDDATGKEQRHSIGTRWWKNGKNWRLDFEGVYQLGNVGASNIRAWTLSMNNSYIFDQWKWKPEVGLKTEFISGNKKYGDGKTETFNPLYPKGAYFGLAALIGPSNLIDIHPSLSFALSHNLAWVVDYDIFWRYSINDGIYAVNMTRIYDGNVSLDKYIGDQIDTNIDWTPNRFVLLRAEVTWFQAAGYLRDASAGKNIFFTGITTQLKF